MATLSLFSTPAPQQQSRPALFSRTPATRRQQEAQPLQAFAMGPSDYPALPAAAETAATADVNASIMHAFSEALEQWTLTVGDPFKVASHMPLLARYEAICESEIAALEAQLQQPSTSATRAGALEAEATLLRGERSSWRLLRLLYSDFEARQQEPPELPRPPEDWGKELRSLGPTPPKLDPAQIAARAVDHEAAGGLSRAPANAGLSVRPLHDEAVLEEGFVAADPLLDLGGRLKGWLEHAAAERVRVQEVNAEMAWTRNRLDAALASKVQAISAQMRVPQTLDGLKSAARELGLSVEHSTGGLADRIVARLGVASEVGEQAAHLPSSLDPDAPFVEGKRLDENDEAAQASLLLASWQLVRAGSVGRAMQLCRRCGQEWRAATLGGGEPWRYDEGRRAWAGNPERALWRGACDAIASRAAAHSQVPGSMYEGALYGALSGSESSLPLVRAACRGWEDKVWAHLNCALTGHLGGLGSYYTKLGMGEGLAEGMGEGEGEGGGGAIAPAEMRLSLETLLLALDQAADADGSDPPSARSHHALQRRLFDLRVKQLPTVAAATATAAAAAAPPAVGSQMSDDGSGTGIPPQQTSSLVVTTAAADGALAELLETAKGLVEGIPAAGTPYASPAERAHLLRFTSHASFFLYLPLLGSRGQEVGALPCLGAWREVLCKYLKVLGETAAGLATAAEAAPSAPVAGGGSGYGVLAGLVNANEGASPPPTIEQMSGAVALIASNLRTEQGNDDDMIVREVGDYLGALPTSLPRTTMSQCMSQAHRLLAPHLTPLIALRTATAIHSAPLSPSSADLPSLVSKQMEGLRWLLLHEPSAEGGGAAMALVHHALALCLLLVRRTVAFKSGDLDALLPPRPPPPSGGAVERQVAVASASFVLLQHQSSDGLTLLVHTPAADGQVGAPTAYYALALLAGNPAAIPLQLPCRCRLTLLTEDDAYCFRIEELERLPADEALVSAAAQAASRPGEVKHTVELPPNLALMDSLQRYCVDCRHALGTAGVVLPPKLEADLTALQTELHFWGLALRAAMQLRGWEAQAACKPLSGAAAAFSSGSQPNAVEWSLELQRRARRLSNTLHEVLTVKLESMGALPTPDEVAAAWGVSTGSLSDAGGAASAGATMELRASDGLAALRCSLVPGLVRSLHGSLLETGKLTGEASWLHESFGVTDLLADDRYRLVDCFDRKGLVAMLTRLRSSALEMLAN